MNIKPYLKKTCVVIFAIMLFSACSNDSTSEKRPLSEASQYTKIANAAIQSQLHDTGDHDFREATKGLIAKPDALEITDQKNSVIWRPSDYQFIQGTAPDTVNPSLWRQAKLNNQYGLFKVVDGLYQVRGFDLSNMTLIEGKSGWIIIDPLTTIETSRAAFAFAQQHLGKKPVSAIIYTHSHIDHFGGVLGIISEEQLNEKNIPIIAPQYFMEEATSENILAGTAMARRAVFMYGKGLDKSPVGHIDSGLGKAPAYGSTSIASPTKHVSDAATNLTIDGIAFEFLLTPNSEAPSEFVFYLPEMKAFCGSDLIARTMLNLYTLRGAKVRDALKWSGYIDQAKSRFSEAEVYFASHGWPMWGQEKIQSFMTQQRDTYKYIHDQTVRLMNDGLTPNEIAENLQMPSSLQQSFSNRGYYGTLKHNAKAVYQFYSGWYDGNPANLDPLPHSVSAQRYVDIAGGPVALLQHAQDAFDKGDYRWAAELLNHLVFADSNNIDATTLLAATYDQMGFQSESAPWRDNYLTAAYELRNGPQAGAITLASQKLFFTKIPISRFLESFATRLDGKKAEGLSHRINLTITDFNQNHVLWIENSVLHHAQGDNDNQATATLKISHSLFIDMLIGEAGIKEVLFSADIATEGSKMDLLKFFSLFEPMVPDFPIVTP